jgi:hypothetical protein
MGKLEWIGDDIGLNPGEDVTVELRDPQMPGGAWRVSLAEALAVTDRLDDRACQRLGEALPFCAEHGYLSAADLAVWQAHARQISVLLVHGGRAGFDGARYVA